MEANIYLVHRAQRHIPKNLGIPGGTWAQAVGQRPREVPVLTWCHQNYSVWVRNKELAITTSLTCSVDDLPFSLLPAESQLDSAPTPVQNGI